MTNEPDLDNINLLLADILKNFITMIEAGQIDKTLEMMHEIRDWLLKRVDH